MSKIYEYLLNIFCVILEKYKKEGAIMKEKYLNKDISKKEFKKWIEESKNKI